MTARRTLARPDRGRCDPRRPVRLDRADRRAAAAARAEPRSRAAAARDRARRPRLAASSSPESSALVFGLAGSGRGVGSHGIRCARRCFARRPCSARALRSRRSRCSSCARPASGSTGAVHSARRRRSCARSARCSESGQRVPLRPPPIGGCGPAPRSVRSRAAPAQPRGEDRIMSTHTADRAPLLRLGPDACDRPPIERRALRRSRWPWRHSGASRCSPSRTARRARSSGAGLVALAAPLARGRRRALLAAAGLVLASLALDDDAIARPGLAAVVLLAALLVCAPAFRASGDPATRRLIVPAAGLLAIGLVADLARAGGHLAHPLGATLLVGACLLAARTLRPWRAGTSDDPRSARARRAHRRRACDGHAGAVHAAGRQAVLLRRRRHELHRLSRGRRRRARLGRPRGRRGRLPCARRCLRALRGAARVDARRARRRHGAPAALARRRTARPLHGRRGHRRSGGVLARGTRDPQGAPVGRRGSSARAIRRRRCTAARSTSRLAARIAEIAVALARRPRRDRATRWRSRARPSIASRDDLYVIARDAARRAARLPALRGRAGRAARSRSPACAASATRPTASTSS